MAIINSIFAYLQGIGVASTAQYAKATSSTITANAVTVATTAFPALTSNSGKVRVKVSGVDGTHAIVSCVITITDGTTTEYVDTIAVASGVNGQGANYVREFCSDLQINKATAVVTFSAGVTTAVVDVEIAGNLGVQPAGTSTL